MAVLNMAKRLKCIWCGKPIPVEREWAARSRGSVAKYCSDKCRATANTSAYRARKKH